MNQYRAGDLIAGRYLVKKTIKSGGMGLVFICVDILAKRNVALKTFSKEFFEKGIEPEEHLKIRDLFEKEALNWVRLGEQNHIVTAYLVHTLGGRLFIVSDAIIDDAYSSLDLRRFIFHYGRLNPKVVANFSMQIALGMHYATNKLPDLVHCDLKPENVLVTEEGVCKVSDFGIARASFVTGSGGTPPYMSPEQWRRAGLDLRSDIYALGCIAYEMLVGYPPFLEDRKRISIPDLRSAHENKEPQIRVLGIPQHLRDFIATCLRKSPADRYPDWLSVINELNTVLSPPKGKYTPLTQSPKQPDPLRYIEQILSLFQLAKFSEALKLCDELTSLHPEIVEFWSIKAQVLSAFERYDEALDILDNFALAKDPKNSIAWHSKAMILASKASDIEDNEELSYSLFEEALRCVDCSLQWQPTSAQFWGSKASILHLLGYFQAKGDIIAPTIAHQIILCLNQALKLDPAALEVRNELMAAKIRALRAISSSEQVLKEIDSILERYPGLIEIWVEKALILISMEILGEAQNALNMAKRIDPSSFTVASTQDYLNSKRRPKRVSGKSLLEQLMPSDSDDHSAHLWELVNNDKRNIDFWLADAEWLQSQQMYSEALLSCDRALELDEWFSMTWALKGKIHGDMGQFPEAIDCLKRSVSLDPQETDYWFLYGIALWEEERYDEALNALNTSCELGNQLAKRLIIQMEEMGKGH